MCNVITVNFKNHGTKSVLNTLKTKSGLLASLIASNSVIDAKGLFDSGLVYPKPDLKETVTSQHDQYTNSLFSRFGGTKPFIRRTNCYAGGLNDFDISFSVSLPADTWPKAKANQGKTMSGLVLDVNNYLYRRYGLPVHCPSVKVNRASNGVKTISFRYAMVSLDQDSLNHLKGLKLVSNY